MRSKHYLKEWRKSKGYSQEKLSEKLEEVASRPEFIGAPYKAGYDRSVLSKIESGKVAYSQNLLDMLAEVYNTEPGSLIMRNPLIKDAPHSILDGLSPTQCAAVLTMIEELKKTGTNG